MTGAEDEIVRDRFRGLMVGIAVGDCLGRPIEGHREIADTYIAQIRDGPPALVYTDDTAMSISLAESLLACDGFSGADMGRRFAEGYRDEPHRGYGANVVDVFEQVLAGVEWDQAARRQFAGEGSYGNGGAMRVSPVALWAFRSIEETARLAANTARVTHTHPVGVEGAVIQAVNAWHALRDDLQPDRLLNRLGSLVGTRRFRSKLGMLPTYMTSDDDELARVNLGNGVTAHESVVTALYCFLLADGFEDAIVRALRLGGDTDTIAAMTGALAGARHGFEEIPELWRHVEAVDRLLHLADSIFERIGEGAWAD